LGDFSVFLCADESIPSPTVFSGKLHLWLLEIIQKGVTTQKEYGLESGNQAGISKCVTKCYCAFGHGLLCYAMIGQTSTMSYSVT